MGQRESVIQAFIVKKFKDLDFFVIKMHLLYITGIPDLLFILPNGRVLWVEVKRPGEEPTKKQQWMHNQLTRLGHCVAVVHDYRETLVAVDTFRALAGEDYGPNFQKELQESQRKEKAKREKASK